MKAVRSLLVFVLFSIFGSLNAQNTDRYWAFGDSAGIDFSNLSSPVPASSILRSRGTSASICDSAGNLLFYCGTPRLGLLLSGAGNSKFGFVVNKNHQIMQNGDSLIGNQWYQEMIIVPDPGNPMQYYIFCLGVSSTNNGLYYSKVDLSYNLGLGKVIQKNIRLSTDTMTDGVAVTRNGNGRDWWVLMRNWTNPQSTNKIMVYNISPFGISLYSIQNIGIPTIDDGFFRLKFNADGSKLYNVSARGIIERFDFDRCSGMLSNETAFEGLSGPPYKFYWGFEVSPDESKLYVSSIYQSANQDTSYLIQFDLNAANFAASADTIASFQFSDLPGLLQKGPNNKIYMSIIWNVPDTCFDWSYCYGSVSATNSYLSVINTPDSAGATCNFQPFSFYLGGHKAYLGLPNNPNYELGKWSGSPCDTLTVGLSSIDGTRNELKLYYSDETKTVFINADKLSGRTANVQFYTSSGQLLEELSEPINAGYFTYSSNFAYQPSGVYVVRLQTDKEVLTGKFVKQ